ncbi:MAG: hypothetical protein ACE5F4_02315 [Candidatus Paceibacteria bacterium]
MPETFSAGNTHETSPKELVYFVPPMTDAYRKKDRAMEPVMKTIGVPGEAPQETHVWNVDNPPVG